MFQTNSSLYILTLVVITLGITVTRCKKEKSATLEEWGFHPSAHFPEANYQFKGNTLTYDRFKLGRKLFYDPILSKDGTISCASCHEQPHAFAGHNTPFSAGVNGAVGKRNSPSIANMAWNTTFLWDGGVNHLEIFPLAPITNPLEMDESITNVISKLQSNKAYTAAFKQAYGSETITDQLLFRALAQFGAMIISDNSKYDQVIRGEATFTETENNGYQLFKQKCAQCHTEPLFTDNQFHNNGLDSLFTADLGRGQITQSEQDNGKFKTPSLRNAELTYPYMHDGRFFTLNQVYEHYNSGIKNSSTLDSQLKNGIPLNQTQRYQLTAFIKTLTDYSLLKDPFLAAPKN